MNHPCLCQAVSTSREAESRGGYFPGPSRGSGVSSWLYAGLCECEPLSPQTALDADGLVHGAPFESRQAASTAAVSNWSRVTLVSGPLDQMIAGRSLRAAELAPRWRARSRRVE